MVTPQTPGPEQQGPGGESQVPPSGSVPAPAQGHVDPSTRQEALKARIRLIGSIVIAVLAVLTLAGLGPDTTSHASDRLVIWADDSTNQDRTQGAPQQSVVNGWTGNALLDLISEQLEETTQPDHRPAVLLTLGVLLLALSIVTTPSASRRE